jgi:hypothetical protein
MDIPGLGTLYSILKRDIDRKNDIFRQRQELSSELMANCRAWSEVLVTTFRGAVNRWTTEGREAAANDIRALEMDFLNSITTLWSRVVRYCPFCEKTRTRDLRRDRPAF